MSPMSQYMILSLSQIIKIMEKYNSLCNTFALSRIKFAFPMDSHWDVRHQPRTSLLGNSIVMVTQLSWQLSHFFVLKYIEFIRVMEFPWDDRHQSHTSLLWQLSCHGNQSETSITPLF